MKQGRSRSRAPAILFLGDPGAVAAADDSDVDVGAVYLIERCALSGLRAAAEIFHADELTPLMRLMASSTA